MKSLIFDVDGTLWDSTGMVADAWNTGLMVFPMIKRKLNKEDLKKQFGLPMVEIFRNLFPEIAKERSEEEAAELYEEIANVLYESQEEAMKVEGGILYPGIEKTIKKLAERYRLYIVSNCQCGYIESFLEKTELSEYFDGHLCFGDTGLSKGQTIRRLMDNEHIEDAVYIGDIEPDAYASKEAGIPFIWAAYGFGEVKDGLYENKINNPEELLKLF